MGEIHHNVSGTQMWSDLSSVQLLKISCFFIGSLLVFKLSLGMEIQTHSFHPSKHPKDH